MIIPLGLFERGRYQTYCLWVLICANAVIWLMQMYSETGLREYWLNTGEPVAYQWLTHFFMHSTDGIAGFLHLAGNMLFLWAFGSALNIRYGNIGMAVIYVSSGLVAAAAFYLGGPYDPIWPELPIALSDSIKSSLLEPEHVKLVGASGAVMGIVGAVMYFFPNRRMPVFYVYWLLGRVFQGRTEVKAIWLCLIYIGLDCLYLAFSSDQSTAYLAHIGGFASGFLLSLLASKLGLLRKYNDDLDSFVSSEVDSIRKSYSRWEKRKEDQARLDYERAKLEVKRKKRRNL